MILTITINPLLERRLTYKTVYSGKENRSDNELYTAGGKGINVQRQLKYLETPGLSLTFLGGNNGKIMRNLLASEGLDFAAVSTKMETRSAVLIKDEEASSLTTFFGPNSVVSSAEAEEFKTKMRKMIENCETVVFSGSSPSEAADEIFPYGIQLANELDKISVLDTYGRHFLKCIEMGPTVIHNNLHESEKSTGISLSKESEVLDYLNMLYSKGVKQAFLTSGGEPLYASNFGFIYKAAMPSIKEADATGSGDAFTAGIAYGLHNALTFEETIRAAAAIGAANAAKWTTCNAAAEEWKDLRDLVKVSTIGKKINDLPKE